MWVRGEIRRYACMCARYVSDGDRGRPFPSFPMSRRVLCGWPPKHEGGGSGPSNERQARSLQAV